MNLQKLGVALTFYCFLTQVSIILSQNIPRLHLNKSLHISFFITKNYTGHYLTKWAINRDSPQIPNRIAVDLKSSFMNHNGTQSFHLGGFIAVPPSLPQAYEYFPGVGYYKFYKEGVMSFFDASSKCINDGAHLAIINSEVEANVLVTIFKRYPDAKDYAYLGFHDMNEEGKFVTIFGEPLETTNFIKWAPNEPGIVEDCGSLHRSGFLNDLYCNEQGPWPFFCEYDLSWNGN